MKKSMLLIAAVMCSVMIYAQDQKPMNAVEAQLKAIQLNNSINSKKKLVEAEKTRVFQLYDKEMAAESTRISKEKKDEFETTSEFNARIEKMRVELSDKYQSKKDDYIKTVYDVEKEKNIKALETELADIMISVYDLPAAYFSLKVGKYNADGSYYDLTFSYYIRTVEDPNTKKKTYIWEDPPLSLKWTIERDKAKEINAYKDELIKTVKASIFRLPDDKFVMDKYDVYLIDPKTNNVLFNTLVYKDPVVKKMFTTTKVKSDEKIAAQIFVPTIPNLRLRDNPVSGNVIRLLSAGEKVKVIERGTEDVIEGYRGRWVKVKSQDKGDEGWCFDFYLKEVK